MLKLEAVNVAEKWETFRPEIEAALPPISVESPDRMNNVLEQILIGNLECYAAYRDRDDGGKELLALVTLTVGGQLDSKHRDFIIYTLTGSLTAFTEEEWFEGIECVKDIGRSKGCSRILLYSNDAGVLALLKRYGADTSYRVVTFPI